MTGVRKDSTGHQKFCTICAAFLIKPLHDYLIKTLQIENIKVKPQQDNAAVEMSWGGLSDCEKIYNFLYNDANIFLRRKLDKLDKILCLGQYEV